MFKRELDDHLNKFKNLLLTRYDIENDELQHILRKN